jgi:drug/metabolite transporter (DMT)-like permease
MEQSTSEASDKAKGILAGFIAALIWGAFPVVTRLGVEEGGSLDMFDVTALRFGVAGLVLLPFLLKRGFAGVGWKPMLLIVCGAGVPYMLVVSLGLTYAPAGHFGVITPSTMLAFSALAGWFVLKDKPDAVRVIGLIVILIGVVCIGWRSLTATTENMYFGDLCFVLGGILWGTYTVSSKAWNINPFHSTAIVSVLSMVLFLPVYFAFRGPEVIAEAPKAAIVQAVYQGIFSAFLALFLYSRAVSFLGAAQGAVFAALVPGIAVIMAVPVLDETPTTLEMIGVFIVTTGMVFSLGIHRSLSQTRTR